jgi:lipid A 3-O-deacylase
VEAEVGQGRGKGQEDMRTIAAVLMAALLSLTAPARAAETPSMLELGAGIFDIGEGDAAAVAGLEWRGQPLLWWLRPMLGAQVTSDAGLYGYAGLAFELWWFDRQLVLTPSAAVGAYRRGNGSDLGHTIEFRTGATLQYRFANDVRIGLAFHHLSNAGLGRRNPGEETLMLTYSVPSWAVFGR